MVGLTLFGKDGSGTPVFKNPSESPVNDRQIRPHPLSSMITNSSSSVTVNDRQICHHPLSSIKKAVVTMIDE